MRPGTGGQAAELSVTIGGLDAGQLGVGARERVCRRPGGGADARRERRISGPPSAPLCEALAATLCVRQQRARRASACG